MIDVGAAGMTMTGAAEARMGYELFRIVTDYEALQEAFIDRIEDLNVSRIAIDEAGGFTPGYSAKLLCQPPVKRLGAGTLDKMLRATGMALILVIDDERFAEVKAALSKRKRKVRAVARIKRVKGYFTKENAAECGRKRWLGVSDLKKSQLARRAANARHRANRRHKRIAAAEKVTAAQPDGDRLQNQDLHR